MNTFNGCILLLGLIGGCWLGGCGGGDVNYEDFKAANPDVRIRVIVLVGENEDAASVPYLIECLEAKESHVRLLAFVALKKITNGRTMGWHYTKKPSERKACVDRWRKWIKEEKGKDKGNRQQGQQRQRQGQREQGTGNKNDKSKGNGKG